LKARLQAEGLFDPAKKRPIPQMPTVIGVITSPTGAVIRDILHRIRERWPCHVLVWPVVVQGDQAAQQVAAAIAGFNSLGRDSKVPRPDVLIVARGGGSVEDLWAFNDEALARAVAASTIPVISAVGHETDTTLIDFVSDRRAPTPTAAAEMASPVLAELKAAVMDLDRRLMRAGGRVLEDRRVRLSATSRGLPRPADLLSVASQRFDLSAGRLNAALERNVSLHDRDLMRFAARLTPSLLDRPRRLKAERLSDLATRLGLATRRAADQAERRARLPELTARMAGAVERRLSAATERLSGLDKLRLSLDPNRPLELGFARVHHADGSLARSGAELAEGEAVRLVFAHDSRQALISDAAAPPPTAKSQKVPSKKTAEGSQGSLF
jgi:exodeoxyribonuclease VII large subunit